MKERRLIFLIPARGGSKGIPGKNLCTVGGIPLVGRAARTARLAAQLLAEPFRVVCSTDDSTIADAAREWGAEVPFIRPSELANDTASSMDVVIHALDESGKDAETVVLLQPTSPLTEPKDVVRAVRLHQERGVPVVSVVDVEHPLEWTYRLSEDGALDRVFPGGSVSRRQDAEKVVCLNGAIYVANVSWLKENKSFLSQQTLGMAIPVERSVDVDRPADLEIARAILAARSIQPISIGNRLIGPGHSCFIIAEAGVNHNGSLEMALRLVDAAAEAGADAVKFQTFKAEKLASVDAPKAAYQIRTTGEAESQFDMLRRLELSESAHRELVEHCERRGIMFLSSPFDEASADLLETLGVASFKIPSGEITNLPFLAQVARKGRPMIVSTGMSTLAEVEAAVQTIASYGNPGLALLHCVSNYPADPKDVNLQAMATMQAAFCVPIGYSDHTQGGEVAIAAVALGASVLEKHFTLDRRLPGPDQKASIEPRELGDLVRHIRVVEASLGDGRKAPAASEADTSSVARKSLVAACDIHAGVILNSEMVVARRPGTGIPPSLLSEIVGRTAVEFIPAGTQIRREMLR